MKWLWWLSIRLLKPVLLTEVKLLTRATDWSSKPLLASRLLCLSPDQRFALYRRLMVGGKPAHKFDPSDGLDNEDLNALVEDASAVLQFVFPIANIVNNAYDVGHVAVKFWNTVSRRISGKQPNKGQPDKPRFWYPAANNIYRNARYGYK